MEVHAPSKPIVNLKEAGVHLVIVTIGILIALSFDGVYEWSHNRSLVREARQNLRTEIQDNQRELQRLMTKIDGMRNNFMRALDAVATPGIDAQAQAVSWFQPGQNPKHVLYGYDQGNLSTASKTTAEITGAFSLMEYSEVKKYAQVYNTQALFQRVQEESLSNAVVTASVGLAVLGNPSAGELEEVKRQLRMSAGSILAIEEMANALLETYKNTLADPE